MSRFVPLLLIALLGISAEAQDFNKNDLSQIQAGLDVILNATRSVNGSGKETIVNNAIELKALVSKLNSPRTVRALNDAEMSQLLSAVRGTGTYASQKAAVTRATANAGLWMSQLMTLLPLVDESNKHDLVSSFFRLVVDPENVDQLMQGSSTNVYVVAAPPPAPAPVVKGYEDSEVTDLTKRLKAAWPFRGQKVILENLNPDKAFKMRQVKQLTDVLDFTSDKKTALAMLLPTVLDPENIDVFFEEFWTQSDKEYLNSLVKRPKK